MNEGSPAIVVLLDSARSAEPPHSSGSVAARAPRTLPDAARVARPFASASKTGRAFSKPSGREPSTSRSRRAARSGWALRQAAYRVFHALWAALPRFLTSRAWASTALSTSKDFAGSKPSSSLVAAISASPSAEPWDLPVPRSVGAGHAMTVCRRTRVGLVRERRLLSSAASSASTSSV